MNANLDNILEVCFSNFRHAMKRSEEKERRFGKVHFAPMVWADRGSAALQVARDIAVQLFGLSEDEFWAKCEAAGVVDPLV